MATFGRVVLALGVGLWTIGVEGAVTGAVGLWLVGAAFAGAGPSGADGAPGRTAPRRSKIAARRSRPGSRRGGSNGVLARTGAPPGARPFARTRQTSNVSGRS